MQHQTAIIPGESATSTFSFELQGERGLARAGVMHTPHGDVPTPVYMPVGTQATVKALDNRDCHESNSTIILGNTYHLYLRPTMAKMSALGGLHQFMGWHKPILTDSGGFQVFSLGKEHVKIKDDGVEFKSYLDGSKHFFSPSKAIEIQHQIGADIMMAFDECTPDAADTRYARQALDRTHRWAQECIDEWERRNRLTEQGKYQALFGIVQGGSHQDLRRESAEFITSLPFDGIAVGGETIGYQMDGTQEVMDWIEPLLPKNKPRYAMGLGLNPSDLVAAVLMGFDMFDCVAPTRLARNGTLYVGHLKPTADGKVEWKADIEGAGPKGRLSIGKAQFSIDQSVIQDDCDCTTCVAGYTRAYLQHLYKASELTYYRLASIHNVRVMVRLGEQLRHWVLTGEC